MDRISGLTDELLVKILSYLPTKDAVSTSILSSRWEFLWLWLPKLEYVCRQCPESDSESDTEEVGLDLDPSKSLRSFLDRTMPLHRAPVIESFRLYIRSLNSSYTDSGGVRMWLVIALSRQVRELDISHHGSFGRENVLPSSLYSCKSLVTLKLYGCLTVDVPRMAGLPSLKNLQQKKVSGVHGESLRRLLSACSALENLLVHLCYDSNIGKVTVIVPSLLSLSLIMRPRGVPVGVEIKTPSLKYLKLEDLNTQRQPFSIEDLNTQRQPFSIEDMPKLEEAFVDVQILNIKSLIRSIIAVKRLTLCSQVDYGNGIVFSQLKRLKLCDCKSNLLVRLLQDSPNLQVLDIFQMEHYRSDIDYWIQPSTVPECFLSSLQTFEWLKYLGRPQERDAVVYILKNARGLKTATIWCDERLTPKFEMLQDLSRSSRASATCELIFY